jgi:hypothetical protein
MRLLGSLSHILGGLSVMLVTGDGDEKNVELTPALAPKSPGTLLVAVRASFHLLSGSPKSQGISNLILPD